MEFHGCTTGVVIIVGSVVAALLLVTLARRLFPREALEQSHDVTGALLAVVGTLYAVLLGLIVVDAFVKFDNAIDVVQHESNSLADIYLLAGRLPQPERDTLRASCRAYAREVVEDEWPRMAVGHASMAARKTAFELTQCLEDFDPRTEAEKIVYPMILEQIRQLWDYRRERIGTAEFGIPAVEWVVLIVGGGVTVLLIGFFRAGHRGLQLFLTSLAALLIGLNLYLVNLFGYPFTGELVVSSRPFQIDVALFEGRYEDLPLHRNERARD